jgi:hypothetical protein
VAKSDSNIRPIYPAFFLLKSWHGTCFLPSMIKPIDRRPAFPPKTANPLVSLLEGDDAEVFQIDRCNIMLQLRSLKRAINEGAEEMEMVAIERVFGKSLSRTLTRGGQKLRLAARDLTRILGLLEAAQVPKAPTKSKPRPFHRRKARK